MFQQIVTKPTRGNKILSVIVTDLHEYYSEPEILPPVKPDVIGNGVPSDHSTPFSEPIRDWSKSGRKKYRTITIRRMPESGVQRFGQWISKESFTQIFQVKSSTEKVRAFQNLMKNKIDDIFPEKTIKIFHKDKEWMTEQVQKIRRQKNREYRKNQKSIRFMELHEFQEISWESHIS